MTAVPVRDRLLMSAIDLLRSKGADGFGMTELMTHSGVARRSMYQHFPEGKAQLLAESTAVAGRYASRQLATRLAGQSAVDGFVQALEDWKTALAGSDYTFGCPLVAAAIATAEYPAAAERAAEAFAELSGQITEAFLRDGAAVDTARSAGQMLIASMEGAIIISRAQRSTEPFDALIAHVRHTWG